MLTWSLLEATRPKIAHPVDILLPGGECLAVRRNRECWVNDLPGVVDIDGRAPAAAGCVEGESRVIVNPVESVPDHQRVAVSIEADLRQLRSFGWGSSVCRRDQCGGGPGARRSQARIPDV